MSGSPIKAIVFDVGGTLLTYQATKASVQRYMTLTINLLEEHGISVRRSPEELFQTIQAGIKAYKRVSEQNLEEWDPERIWSEFALADLGLEHGRLKGLCEQLCFLYDLERREITFRPGLRETLEALRSRGYRLGIISNVMSTSFAPHILKVGNVDDLFEDVQLSSVCHIRKPDPAIFDRSLRGMGLRQGEAVYVGDTISRDIIGAQAAHWPVIQIDNPGSYYHDTELVGKYHPDAWIQDFRELPGLMDAWPPASHTEYGNSNPAMH